MNLSMMLLLHDFAVRVDRADRRSERDDPDDAGPSTPRPADPSPDGGESEPVVDDDEDRDRDRGERGGEPPCLALRA